MSSTPIRVGFIGLGTATSTGPGAWGATAHLPALLSSPKYKIVALANSSVASAEASIAYHKLPSSVKAYGTPEGIAADPDVDLIVCSVVVTKHYILIKPALLAGKDVYVEWPLGASTAETEELTTLAKEKGVKTVVGVQARADPLVMKLKELVDGGRIGRVVSSTVVGAFAGFPATWTQDTTVYLSIDSGGNSLTIYYGHFLDTFINVLGTFDTLNSLLKTDRKTGILVDAAGDLVDPAYPITSPDHIFVHGTLNSGVSASINFRAISGKTVSGTGVRWTITGTEGEIEVSSPEVGWQYGMPGQKILMRTGDKDEVEEVDFTDKEEKQYVSAVGLLSKNPARIYEAFAEGEKNKYATFEDAMDVNKVLDGIKKGSL
ncbi:Aspirochlorine biosynthesis E [Hyphodiscus hymeniophilus]|uniref:Aspirochlorine biosynthesis E n=1 Tax=Hyphodiscus hymeniophilus TaxID=353542 RepID=A0A9P6VQP1_9HELO|nr:Aspirochlorine biosynthesis E [Hyphodiscus hymeniophilus]